MPFKITKAHHVLKYASFTFPGGELSVKVDADHLGFLAKLKEPLVITARIKSAADIIELALLKNALWQKDEGPVELFMPYIPYARQDRTCNPGEAFSLRVFAGLINDMRFSKVTVVDPHSDVVAGVFDRLHIISQKDVIHRWDEFNNRVRINTVIVSPDAGANKKIGDIAGYLGHERFIRADKLRDLATGKIKETIVFDDNIKGLDVVIIDDIGDGMKTFTELAKVLKGKGIAKVILYITHGIYSKGAAPLYEGGIDEVWTTNSFHEDIARIDPKAKVFDVATLYP